MQPVLVFTEEGRPVGLAIDEIVDIVEERLDIELKTDTPGVIGAAIIKGKAVEIVDVSHYLGRGLGGRQQPDPRERQLGVGPLVDLVPDRHFLDLPPDDGDHPAQRADERQHRAGELVGDAQLLDPELVTVRVALSTVSSGFIQSAVTGSIGKTTTSRLLSQILDQALAPTFTTPKSINTLMGITREIRERRSLIFTLTLHG